MGSAKIPPVRLVRTGLTGAERWVQVESREHHAVRLSDEELGDGGVGGGAEGGAARRGHALAVVCTDWCCTDERFRSTRRVRPRRQVGVSQGHKLTSLQGLSGGTGKELTTQ